MNKIFLFAVLIGAVAAQSCQDSWGALCAVQAPAECDSDKSGVTTDKEYKSVACNAYIKKVDATDACSGYDKCVKDAANAAQEAKYLAFCPTDKAKCAGSDTSVNCAAWAKAGECQANADWMLAKCSNSCCPVCTDTPVVEEGECPTDSALCTANSAEKGVTCEEWATSDHNADDSECQLNPEYMNKFCQQSCCESCFLDKNKCPTQKSRCANEYAAEFDLASMAIRDAATMTANAASCKKWAAAGECSANSKWMMEFCGKECCPICVPRAPASSPVVYSALIVYTQPVFYGQPVFGVYGSFGGRNGFSGLPYGR